MWKRKRKGRIHSPRRVVPNNGRPFFGRSADKMEYELHLATKLRRPSVSAVCHKDPHTRLYTVCVCVCVFLCVCLYIALYLSALAVMYAGWPGVAMPALKISNPILGFKVASDWINVGVWVITNNTVPAHGFCFYAHSHTHTHTQRKIRFLCVTRAGLEWGRVWARGGGSAACRVPLTHPRVSSRDDTSDGRSCKVHRCSWQ